MSMNDLDNLRKQIDEIDTELVKLFERRMEQSLQIAEYKIRKTYQYLMKSGRKRL